LPGFPEPVNALLSIAVDPYRAKQVSMPQAQK